MPIIEAERCPACQEPIAPTEVHVRASRGGCHKIVNLAEPAPIPARTGEERAGRTDDNEDPYLRAEVSVFRGRGDEWFVLEWWGDSIGFVVSRAMPSIYSCDSGPGEDASSPDTAAERERQEAETRLADRAYFRTKIESLTAERDALKAEVERLKLHAFEHGRLAEDTIRELRLKLSAAESESARLREELAKMHAGHTPCHGPEDCEASALRESNRELVGVLAGVRNEIDGWRAFAPSDHGLMEAMDRIEKVLDAPAARAALDEGRKVVRPPARPVIIFILALAAFFTLVLWSFDWNLDHVLQVIFLFFYAVGRGL